MTTKAAKTVFGFALAVFAVFGAGLLAVHAQGVTAEEVLPEELGAATGLGSGDLRVTIARIIRVAFGLLGVVAVLLILYGGFLYMTAKGVPEQIDKAKKVIIQAAIGLVIILSAVGITTFIINVLLGQVPGLGGGQGEGSSAGQEAACIGLSATCPAGALGNGIVESHYPARNASGVPRNTRIVVTFKEAIQPESIVLGSAGTVAILKSAEVAGTSSQFPTRFAAAAGADRFDVQLSEDKRTIVFIQKNCPDQCIGSPTENVFYTVALRGGTSGVKKADGSPAFTGTFNNGYLWEFQTSTKLDTDPPKVSSSSPRDQTTGNPRNTLIQINFNEPVDPTSIKTIAVTTSGGASIGGEYLVGNGYKAVEFRTDDLCGTNSCGESVYCLPANATITARAKADGLSPTPPLGVFPPNGIVDMAGNSLDGDADGAAEGPPGDDYDFTFSTNNAIDLVPPRIVSHEPGINQGSIDRDTPISATFSKLMSLTSFTSTNAKLQSGSPEAPTNYWLDSENVSAAADQPPTQTKASFIHDLLSTNQPYNARFTSGIRDLRQNCFAPPASDSACNDPGNAKPYCCNGFPSDVECAF